MKKLVAVQAALKAPKGQFNKFGGYKYRSCEDILEAVKPLLLEQGLQLTITDEPVEVGGRIYIKATATVTDGSETAAVSGYAREAETKKGMDESQITGTASSYARKYALNGLFLIDDTKDVDATNDHGKGQQARKAAPKPASAPQPKQCTPEEAIERLLAAISGYAGRRGKSADDLFEQLEAKFPDKLSDANWLLLMAERYEAA